MAMRAMNVYRIKCCGTCLYINVPQPLNNADIQLFKSCAVEVRQTMKTPNVSGLVSKTVALFNQKSMLGASVTGAPWQATIEI